LSELLGTSARRAAARGCRRRERRRGEDGRAQALGEALVQARERMANAGEIVVEGTLNRMVGMTLEAVGCEAAVGGRCLVDTAEGKQIEAEVVGFSGDKLIPDAHRRHPRHDAGRARHSDAQRDTVAVGDELLGPRAGRRRTAARRLGELRCTDRVSLTGEPLNPLMRRAIRDPLDVGVRSINSLLTVGGGQRIGLFAGSGVGKSVLLGMMTRYTKADVTVVGLIGERGREVQDFVSNTLGPDGMRRAVVVATPADNPAAHAPARRVARDRHRRVFSRPRPEGAAAARFADPLRAGAARDRARHRRAAGDQGLSALGVRAPAAAGRARRQQRSRRRLDHRVLYGAGEGDDQNDPIADAARAILDGHIVLSRRLAESGLYPAIDVEASISRAMHQIATAEQLDLANRSSRCTRPISKTATSSRWAPIGAAPTRGSIWRWSNGRKCSNSCARTCTSRSDRAQLRGPEATRDAVLGAVAPATGR
jgi:flagellum-specific ATP synthase